MDNKFAQLGILAAGIHFMGSHLVSMSFQDNEKLITEISMLTGNTQNEIIEYWHNSPYDLATIKRKVVRTGKLDAE